MVGKRNLYNKCSMEEVLQKKIMNILLKLLVSVFFLGLFVGCFALIIFGLKVELAMILTIVSFLIFVIILLSF